MWLRIRIEKMIQTHLLDNVHRTILRLRPDPELGRQLDEEEKARLAKIRETLSESVSQQISMTARCRVLSASRCGSKL